MYKVVYYINYNDPFGRPNYTPDYSMYFNATNTLELSNEHLIRLAMTSFMTKNPGYTPTFIRVVSNNWVG